MIDIEYYTFAKNYKENNNNWHNESPKCQYLKNMKKKLIFKENLMIDKIF